MKIEPTILDIKNQYPDFSMEGLTVSNIPRIRILFRDTRFVLMQKKLIQVLMLLFQNEGKLFTLNQTWFINKKNSSFNKKQIESLENCGLGSISLILPDLATDDSVLIQRIIPISMEILVNISIIDAWGRTYRGEKQGLPFIEMDNILFSEDMHFLVHINFIGLDSPDLDGIDISSYDKGLLLKFASQFESQNFHVLTDRIDG